MRIFPPRAVKPLAYLLMGLYGPDGCGKTLLALKCAHRLVAPVGGEIVLFDADEGRAEFYPEFKFRPEPFRGTFSTARLIELLDEYTEMAREAPGTIAIIIDSLTPFWEGKGGLKERNDLVNAPAFGGNTWSAWSVTGPQELDPLYMAMRRFTKFGHLIVCLEQSIDYEGKKAVGVKPKFRDQFGHRMDFMLRAERYFQQETTEREAEPEDAAVSSHRVVIEKVSIARNRPNPDGTTDSEYPVKTGTVVLDADGGVAARLLEYLNEGAANYAEVAKEYVESLKDANREELLKAHGYAKRVVWPEEHRQALIDAIVALGSKFQDPKAAPPVSTVKAATPAPAVDAFVDAVHAAAGMQHTVKAAMGPAEHYSWSNLTEEHSVEQWLQAAQKLDNDCESDIELDAFLSRASQFHRWDGVHELINNRKAELKHIAAAEYERDSMGLTDNDIY